MDLPTTPRDRELVWRSIRDGFSRYAQPGASLGIVGVTADCPGLRSDEVA